MKQFTPTLFVLLLLCIVSGSCDKKLFDYRNKYIGDYRFDYHYEYWEMGGANKDTTITYEGKIAYGGKGNLKIDWPDGSTNEFSVSKKDGEISKCSKVIGTISKKQVQFTFDDNLCGGGPLGSNYVVTFSGTKKK
ncbi:hypothetical protein D3C71_692700 [compost metagenome]